MARIKYYYDTETCKYERVKTKTSDVVMNALGILSLTVAMAVGLLILYTNYFESPKELILKNEIKELEFYYEKLTQDVKGLNEILGDVEHRDDNIYRVVLGAEPIDKDIRNAGAGGADRYEDIREKNIDHEDLVIDLNEKVDLLRRKLYIESKSQDEVVKLAEKKEKLYASIPAIQPISNKQLLALASGFGWRTHPIYKVKKMHTGIDFAASIGTPIYATADGTVAEVSVKFSGYGKMVEVDHGFGYRTRYAHMHEFAVRSGQNVKRGDLIGYVGNTGLSTAPHLHYEVLINGSQVDPVHYFYNDLTAGEYEKVLELASIENQSLGM
ncbi:M23 family metallopeptidase [Ohtaekwangia koreensis]|jgi:murein DD-endopeptidase MepM/ murein hydrolase activator NlpD|uniref:Murein DD-endopeptidase MepM and murein hydrolase activator NlpD, contain LysM domain n=1 Tax=Ohtaekwangia koreensis TaxID=688867 RepID=A0A1T5M315_9BACT|nr:M23 family metallopeptidase [Ohtaekwangia koreensis]SKC82553.1 Murein DD-endopeptidase MepM and murein hydrolase activator NlpD, contain LysM domain [Ohtaekwangia koreensis]